MRVARHHADDSRTAHFKIVESARLTSTRGAGNVLAVSDARLCRAPIERRVHGLDQLVDRYVAAAVRIDRRAGVERRIAQGDVHRGDQIVDRHLPVVVAVASARCGDGARAGVCACRRSFVAALLVPDAARAAWAVGFADAVFARTAGTAARLVHLTAIVRCALRAGVGAVVGCLASALLVPHIRAAGAVDLADTGLTSLPRTASAGMGLATIIRATVLAGVCTVLRSFIGALLIPRIRATRTVDLADAIFAGGHAAAGAVVRLAALLDCALRAVIGAIVLRLIGASLIPQIPATRIIERTDAILAFLLVAADSVVGRAAIARIVARAIERTFVGGARDATVVPSVGAAQRVAVANAALAARVFARHGVVRCTTVPGRATRRARERTIGARFHRARVVPRTAAAVSVRRADAVATDAVVATRSSVRCATVSSRRGRRHRRRRTLADCGAVVGSGGDAEDAPCRSAAVPLDCTYAGATGAVGTVGGRVLGTAILRRRARHPSQERHKGDQADSGDTACPAPSAATMARCGRNQVSVR